MEFMHLEFGQNEIKDNLEDWKEVNRKFTLEYESQKEKVSSVYELQIRYLANIFSRQFKKKVGNIDFQNIIFLANAKGD